MNLSNGDIETKKREWHDNPVLIFFTMWTLYFVLGGFLAAKMYSRELVTSETKVPWFVDFLFAQSLCAAASAVTAQVTSTFIGALQWYTIVFLLIVML